jgi:hypothetical protein
MEHHKSSTLNRLISWPIPDLLGQCIVESFAGRTRMMKLGFNVPRTGITCESNIPYVCYQCTIRYSRSECPTEHKKWGQYSVPPVTSHTPGSTCFDY